MKRGAVSPDHWFYIPTEASRALIGSHRVRRDAIQRRLDCMLCWWKYRSNSQFVQQDSARMLEAMHEAGEMDLASEEGRLQELGTYWMLAFICAHDPWLWDVRAHWEQALLKWRVVHFYCHEHHFAASLMHNERMYRIEHILAPEDVDPVVRENYVKRFPGCPLPLYWISVPFNSMPPSIMSKSAWEVRDGVVTITFRDFIPWAWHQMSRATEDMDRRVNVLRWDDELEGDRIVFDQDMREALGPYLAQCYQVRNEERAAIQAAQASQMEATLPPVASAEDLLAAAKTRMPLCMLQHFWRAFEKGQHPKNGSRVALAKFLLEAGYGVQQVDGIMFGLFSLDREFTRRYGLNGWNDAAYHKKFGNQVVGMHRKGTATDNQRAYGCGSLIKAGQDNEARGCPFFKTAPGSRKDLSTMLDWSGVKEVDIEDIVGRHADHAQERCCRDYTKRSALRDVKVPSIINHPNVFMRGYIKLLGDGSMTRNKDEDVVVVD